MDIYLYMGLVVVHMKTCEGRDVFRRLVAGEIWDVCKMIFLMFILMCHMLLHVATCCYMLLHLCSIAFFFRAPSTPEPHGPEWFLDAEEGD